MVEIACLRSFGAMHHVNGPPGGSSGPAAQPRLKQPTLFVRIGFVGKVSAQEAADQLASASAKQKEAAEAEDAAAAARL